MTRPPCLPWPPTRAAGCLAALLLLGLAGCERAAAPPPVAAVPTPPPLLQAGAAFPPAVLDLLSTGRGASGGPAGADAASLQGKTLVLNLWATWCPPCRSEMPSLERLSQRLDSAHYAVLGLSVDADTHLAQEFLLQQGIHFRNGFDPGGRQVQQLGLPVYPVTFVIAPDRRLLARVTGQRQWDSPKMLQLISSLSTPAGARASSAL